MRKNIVHIGASELTYEIRQIVDVAHRIAKMSGREVFWENIGDPVQKGEVIPDFIKDIIAEAVREDKTYAYSPTRGVRETREFLAEKRNKEGGAKLDPDDILFFNGLGDAVNKVYGLLRREARVIGPSPAYPTHSSAEAAHAGYPPITYSLDPEKGWMPDLDELYNKVKYNESIAGIMIINPDNPTGAVFPEAVVSEMIDIARRFDLFIVADEIYMNMVYNDREYAPISKLIGDVPAIALKGISKEMPWPGGRCGWMEVYNQRNNPILASKMQRLLKIFVGLCTVASVNGFAGLQSQKRVPTFLAATETLETLTVKPIKTLDGTITLPGSRLSSGCSVRRSVGPTSGFHPWWSRECG